MRNPYQIDPSEITSEMVKNLMENKIVEGSRGEKRLMRVADARQRDSKTGTPQTDPKLAKAEKKLTRKQEEGLARIKKKKRAAEQAKHAELDTDEYPGTSVPSQALTASKKGSVSSFSSYLKESRRGEEGSVKAAYQAANTAEREGESVKGGTSTPSQRKLTRFHRRQRQAAHSKFQKRRSNIKQGSAGDAPRAVRAKGVSKSPHRPEELSANKRANPVGSWKKGTGRRDVDQERKAVEER